MKKLFVTITLLSAALIFYGQSITSRLTKAFDFFETDSQLTNAIASLYVVDAKTAEVIFEKNSRVGLAPASTQKIITAAAAYEFLGKDFTYQTNFAYEDQLNNNKFNGDIIINGSGDPTLGSWRWKQTREEMILGNIARGLKNAGIKGYHSIQFNEEGWQEENIPDGWIWQDLGNYYGAPSYSLNWRENQYDLILSSGKKMGDNVTILETTPHLYQTHFISFAKSAQKGTGDNTNIYLPINNSVSTLTGTIPVGENKFVVSGAIPDVKKQFQYTLINYLQANGIAINPNRTSPNPLNHGGITTFYTAISPPLDSIVYWFLKKSINLYGEALIKTIAAKNKLPAITENGVALLKKLWSSHGISITELNMMDGSGLSPANRVTTHAQVSILKYASTQPWFQGYYYSFPIYNGMKMKSGTITGVKGFCGYQTSGDGHQFIFSFLVNNYNGQVSELVEKMYKVLNELK